MLWLTAALSGVGVVTGMAADGAGPARPDVGWLTVALLAGLLVLAGYLHVDFRYGGEVNAMDVFDAVLGLVIYALPGFHAVAVAAVGTLITRVVVPLRCVFGLVQRSLYLTKLGWLLVAAVDLLLGD